MKKDIIALFERPLEELIESANQLRIKHFGQTIDLCSINNIKSGECTEDCTFCSQSIHFKTASPTYDLMTIAQALQVASLLEDQGVHKHSLVSSGKHLDDNDLIKLSSIYKALSLSSLDLCASHGILNQQQAQVLKDSGVKRYHHNLESSSKYYKEICTTHSYQDRIDTIQSCQSVGLEVCSGGIWGLGESREDRIDMLLTLKELQVDSVPINILCPVEGTPLEKQEPLDPIEIMKTLAIYRITLDHVEIRLAGGRVQLEDHLEQVYKCGINGILTGDYLTTSGFTVEKDKVLLTKLGYQI